MIHFKLCRWKNLLSTGNEFTEIQFDRSPTTLIVGQNGAGKSTLLDALSFGLFGKPHRDIKKDQLINSINKKHCVVEVEFKIGASDFRIRFIRLLYLDRVLLFHLCNYLHILVEM